MFKHRNKIITSAIILLTASILLIASAPVVEARPEFALATSPTWSYPDSYGQGIYSFVVYSNATGSWVVFDTYIHDGSHSGEDPIPWNASQAIKVRLVTTLNKTLLGIEDPDLGKNYIRHSVNVTDQSDTSVFSQQNFTYEMETHDFGIYPHLYWYYYYVIFDFLPISGEFYTASFNYEVYY